jgi:hypothetical protein
MNFHDRPRLEPREARLRYLPGEYLVIAPGQFVRCAVTGRPVSLDDLRYWSAEMQEPYFSADIALQRYEQLKAEGRL